MNIHINDFEGPLDLLLHLVKESKMDIYEIRISLIIEQYLDIVHKFQDLNIDVASSYLIMAAELMHLKSRLLLNQNDEEETEGYEFSTEEDLRFKLIEYQKYKDIAQTFRELNYKRSEFYTKDPSNIQEYSNDRIIMNNDITIDDLIKALMEFKKREAETKPVETRITKKELSVKDRIVSIRNILNKKKKLNFIELFDNFSKDYIVVTFLSILDMSKNNEIILTQQKNFDNILIEKRV